jgi:aerobic-type carbon monoxide dehydrogenase small subunit (CoxS/CutS family)
VVSMVTLAINGKQTSFDAPGDIPLLSVLCDVLGMMGTKFDCGIAQMRPRRKTHPRRCAAMPNCPMSAE